MFLGKMDQITIAELFKHWKTTNGYNNCFLEATIPYFGQLAMTVEGKYIEENLKGGG